MIATRNTLEKSIRIGNEMPSVHIGITGELLDNVFDRAIDQWQKERPFEAAVAFPAHMAELRRIHGGPGGKAYLPNKVRYYVGETPRRLKTIVGDLLGEVNWEFDKKVWRAWWNRFKAGRITPNDPIPEDVAGIL